jgi:nicotinate-nucleotide adenylyltransferase
MVTGSASLLGVFGGTFDPIHFGHLRCALDVAESLDAPIRMIPAASPVHRDQPLVTSEHRLNMLKTALLGQQSLVADDREIRRGGPSFMIDTLDSLATDFPDSRLCLVVGEDAFAGLDRWHRWQELFDRCHLVVATRPGSHPEWSAELVAYCKSRVVDDRSGLALEPSGKVLRVPVTPLDIAASDIREQLFQGRSPRYLLPAGVLEYIRREGLYPVSRL